MGSLLRFLKRYQYPLLFVVLEALALFLYFNTTLALKANLSVRLRTVQIGLQQHFATLADYAHLSEENLALVNENIALRNQLEIALRRVENVADSLQSPLTIDSLQYERIAARVVHNTVAQQHNLFTLNRGSLHGAAPQMPVLSHGNVAGLVVAVTTHYARAISLINTDFRISARLKRGNYFGSLAWDGGDYRTALLTEIPHHAEIRLGDSVVTSGFSNIFPPDLLLGVVESVENRGGDFSTARIRLATDFKRLQNVVILDNRHRAELDSLQGNTPSHAE